MQASHKLELGVMGYHARTVTPPKTRPSPAAWLPSMMILPAVELARRSVYAFCFGRFSRAQSYPATAACVFSAAADAFFANCLPMAFLTSSISMSRRCASTPTYMMLTTILRRRASLQTGTTSSSNGTT